LKIADFGLALMVDESALTKKSSVLGTPAYMSPEQIRGETLSSQSDLFSVGIVACEVFCATNPFVGKDINTTINSILTFDQEKLSAILVSLPDDLRQIIGSCLQRDKNQRFRSADQILNLLKVNKIESAGTSGLNRYPRPVFYLSVIIGMILLIFIMIRVNDIPEQTIIADSTALQQDSAITYDDLNDQIKEKPERVSNQHFPKNKAGQKKNDTSPEQGNFILIGLPSTTVLIDSQRIGQLPLREFISLPAGIHELRLIHQDYPEYVQELEIKPGSNHILQLNPDTLFGYLNCQIYPWADLYIDGMYKGQTPFLNPLILAPGEHMLTMINPTWPEITDTVVIAKKETVDYKINLEQFSIPKQ
jgi:serine/threonine protein kinase